MFIFSKRIPVAWLNLTHHKPRFVLSILGISFAVVLMLVQVGFWRALMDSQTAMIRMLDADIFIISSTMSTITDIESFPQDRIDQARGVEGVAAARPFYIRYFPFVWRNAGYYEDEVPEWPIRVLAFHPDQARPPIRVEALPNFPSLQDRLMAANTAALDVRSKPMYDAIRRWREGGPAPRGIEREIAGIRIRIVDLFDLGTDFTTDGTLLMTADNLATLSGGHFALERAQFGLISVAPGADVDDVVSRLRRLLPDDVRVLSRSELIEEEEAFWSESTPIGFIFLLGLIVGFVVGVVICYQILSTEVTDHLSEFATLKAIGYDDRYVHGIVIQEALWLSMLGFIVGLAVGWPLYSFLADQTGLPLQLTIGRGMLILLLTVAMCIVSGVLAVRRIRTADPAEVF
ncbi:MAG: ABC transporter permease DevC [Gemmataceae bacterium]|nr:ABC transporter permease DevC [Gemmataceae bacterium]